MKASSTGMTLLDVVHAGGEAPSQGAQPKTETAGEGFSSVVQAAMRGAESNGAAPSPGARVEVPVRGGDAAVAGRSDETPLSAERPHLPAGGRRKANGTAEGAAKRVRRSESSASTPKVSEESGDEDGNVNDDQGNVPGVGAAAVAVEHHVGASTGERGDVGEDEVVEAVEHETRPDVPRQHAEVSRPAVAALAQTVDAPVETDLSPTAHEGAFEEETASALGAAVAEDGPVPILDERGAVPSDEQGFEEQSHVGRLRLEGPVARPVLVPSDDVVADLVTTDGLTPDQVTGDQNLAAEGSAEPLAAAMVALAEAALGGDDLASLPSSTPATAGERRGLDAYSESHGNRRREVKPAAHASMRDGAALEFHRDGQGTARQQPPRSGAVPAAVLTPERAQLSVPMIRHTDSSLRGQVAEPAAQSVSPARPRQPEAIAPSLAHSENQASLVRPEAVLPSLARSEEQEPLVQPEASEPETLRPLGQDQVGAAVLPSTAQLSVAHVAPAVVASPVSGAPSSPARTGRSITPADTRDAEGRPALNTQTSEGSRQAVQARPPSAADRESDPAPVFIAPSAGEGVPAPAPVATKSPARDAAGVPVAAPPSSATPPTAQRAPIAPAVFTPVEGPAQAQVTPIVHAPYASPSPSRPSPSGTAAPMRMPSGQRAPLETVSPTALPSPVPRAAATEGRVVSPTFAVPVPIKPGREKASAPSLEGHRASSLERPAVRSNAVSAPSVHAPVVPPVPASVPPAAATAVLAAPTAPVRVRTVAAVDNVPKSARHSAPEGDAKIGSAIVPTIASTIAPTVVPTGAPQVAPTAAPTPGSAPAARAAHVAPAATSVAPAAPPVPRGSSAPLQVSAAAPAVTAAPVASLSKGPVSVQSRAPASAPVHPMSPAVAPMPESVPSAVIPSLSGNPAVEPHRVRAAVLELQHRIPGASDVATAASRSGFDTPVAGDKKTPAKKNLSARSSLLADEQTTAPARAAAFAPISRTAPTPSRISPTSAPSTAAPIANPSVVSPPVQAAVSASIEDERPRLPATRARPSASVGGDRQAAAASSEQPVRLTTPALPLIPLAGLMVPGTAAPTAPGRAPTAEGSASAINGRERAVIARPAEGQGDAPAAERARDNGVRSGELQAAAMAPRPRPLGESQPASAAAPQSFTARPDAGALSFAPMPAAATPLMDMAAEDQSLHAAVLGKTAHVRLDTGADGELALHMIVKDGVVDVRLDGAASHTLDLRQSDVRTALAGEGISLGRFETGASTGTPFGSNGNGFRDGTAEQNAQGGSAQSGTPAREPHGSDRANAGPQLGGGQLPSHGSSGGGARHFDAQERWAERETPSTRSGTGPSSSSTTSTSSGSPATETGRRRGYHVTA